MSASGRKRTRAEQRSGSSSSKSESDASDNMPKAPGMPVLPSGVGSAALSSSASTPSAALKPRLFITSTADLRTNGTAARLLRQQLFDETAQLGGSPRIGTSDSVVSTIGAVRGIVGSLDSLVGLFRSNYTIADQTIAANNLMLRVAIAKQLIRADVRVDGLGRNPDSGYELVRTYDAFDRARRSAAQSNKNEKNKAKKEEVAGIIAAADELSKALLLPGASGTPPLAAVAVALENPRDDACVLYVTHALVANAITRQRLLSRNDHVSVAIGGNVEYALLGRQSEVLTGSQFAVSRIFSFDLNGVEKQAHGITVTNEGVTIEPRKKH